jgi:perosamine synthetase
VEGIDTNILVYAFDGSSNYQTAALAFIENKISNDRLAIAEFSLLEFLAVITDGRKVKAPLLPKEAYAIITDFWHSESFCILSLSGDECRKMFEESSQKKMVRNTIYDFLIAYTCKINGIKTIYTANINDFKKLGFIQSINPFEPVAPRSAPSAKRLIPYGRQSIDEQDVAAVCSVLRSNWLTTGPKVEEFEKVVADYVGAKYAVAVSSGTAALHCTMYALSIGPGDEVIVPPMTFAATANCIVFQGGTPVFADVTRDTLLIDPAQVEAKITPHTKAIIAVDFAGQPCEYDSLRNIADQNNLVLVADACHALGAEYKRRKTGSLADLNVFSFHPVKHITTGEGGMITTNDAKLAERMRLFRNHGITRKAPSAKRQAPSIEPWFYEMVDLGYNYRITDFQCTLGISQLRKLPVWVARRNQIALRYNKAISDLQTFAPLRVRHDVFHAYHLYVIRIDNRYPYNNRSAVFRRLRDTGIGVNVHYVPVHLHPFYRKHFHTRPGDCPIAEKAYELIMSLPIFPTMSDDDVDAVITSISRSTYQDSNQH